MGQNHATNDEENRRYRRLIFHGMVLFLLGLLVGFAEAKVANPRMGLAAHLEGLMNGTFLIALGAVWSHVNLSVKMHAAAYWGVLYGAYANVFVTTFAAVGWSEQPFTRHRGRAQRICVARDVRYGLGFGTVGIAMIAASVLILWGLRYRG
jgi:(hydroxyamino)benzene mutase